jgi:hypothetical protein
MNDYMTNATQWKKKEVPAPIFMTNAFFHKKLQAGLVYVLQAHKAKLENY